MVYKAYRSYCLAGDTGFPPEAVHVPAPFAPVLFLHPAAPGESRCLYPVSTLAEVGQESTLALVPPPQGTEGPMEAFLQAHGGAAVLNPAYPRCWELLESFRQAPKTGLRVSLVGLGDVGSTVLTGLVLLGREIDEIRIFDPNPSACRRYELEMNQILSPDGSPMPRVRPCSEAELFDCDLFLFTASRGVPPLGQAGDVRMLQFQANRDMLRHYARLARKARFRGLFCQISDPVDHLCRAVFLESNRDCCGRLDYQGLLPEQIQGFGLGVMAARARYCGQKLGIPQGSIRVYGPHGAGLVAANAPGGDYDGPLSAALTAATRDMNLRVRELGFKPYIAPGLSSAAVSILQLLRGQVHFGAVPLGKAYFGCQSRMTPLGPRILQEELAPPLQQRIAEAFRELEEFSYD